MSRWSVSRWGAAALVLVAACAAGAVRSAGTRARAVGQAAPAGDPPLSQADVDRWFDPSLRPVRQGNEVTELVDGWTTYMTMAPAIQATRGPMRVLYHFGTKPGDPAYPVESGGMVEGLDHSLYTTTQQGGRYGKGTICQFKPDGDLKVLHEFDGKDGAGPQGGLTRGKGGELYGTTYGGGDHGGGTVFTISEDGAFRTLYHFCNGWIDPRIKNPTPQQLMDAAGSYPISPPVQGADGALYGITSYANNQQAGVVYRIAGQFKAVLQFTPQNQKQYGFLGCGITAGSDGNCYATTLKGGDGLGAVLRIYPGGAVQALHRFTPDTGGPSDGVMLARDGSLYGTTTAPISGTPGVIYKITKTLDFAVIHTFNIADGADPHCALVQGRDDDDWLYGVTRGGGAHGRGVFFKMRPADGLFRVLHNFADLTAEGRYPTTAVVQHTNGKWYATSSQGGKASAGVFYCMDFAHPDFVYCLNWWMSDNYNLYGPNAPSVKYLLTQADQKGVAVRAMLWDQKPQSLTQLKQAGQNTQEVKDINALYNGAAILDNRTLPGGSHHQKILVVNGPDGLTAFCGGVDFNPDRVSSQPDSPGSPLHDVHCRIRGPAAGDLLSIFKDRWTDHPAHGKLDKDKDEPPDLSLPTPSPISGAHCWVQIGRTFGNSARHGLLNDYNLKTSQTYKFGATGEQSAAKMIVHAIYAARRFIYVEDQYFVDTKDQLHPGGLDVRTALEDKLAEPGFKCLTILIPHGDVTPLPPQILYRRQQLIHDLRRIGGSKVRVFCRQLAPPTNQHAYIHAKVWIFDDQFAIIGSANTNRRSWTHDSEVVAGICDQGDAGGKGYLLPHRLRMRLWAEHLNVGKLIGGQLVDYESQLYDGVKSADLWLKPPPFNRIQPYDEDKGVEKIHTDTLWDEYDPDGS